jgi:CHASE3 domain sensor protein
MRGSMEGLATILREDGRQEFASRLQSQVESTLTILSQMVERTRAGGAVDAGTRDTAKESMDRLRETVSAIRQSETDVLDARIRADDTAGVRVKRLAIAMTGLATALLTLMVGLLVFVVRPGAWRG